MQTTKMLFSLAAFSYSDLAVASAFVSVLTLNFTRLLLLTQSLCLPFLRGIYTHETDSRPTAAEKQISQWL